MPNLHLRVQDLDHPGADLFFRLVGNGKATLKEGILQCIRGLYGPNYSLGPKITQITLTLRSFSGVAYTFGAPSIPFEHKEIHFSLDHIVNTHSKFDGDKDKRTREEIQGVLTHELVHCYQWNAKGTCPGGLIEGIAGVSYTTLFLSDLTMDHRLYPSQSFTLPTSLEPFQFWKVGCRIRKDGILFRLDCS